MRSAERIRAPSPHRDGGKDGAPRFGAEAAPRRHVFPAAGHETGLSELGPHRISGDGEGRPRRGKREPIASPPVGTKPAFARRLFVAERDDRIDGQRAARGQVAREERDDDEQQRCAGQAHGIGW
jgi:hypothetical protein